MEEFSGHILLDPLFGAEILKCRCSFLVTDNKKYDEYACKLITNAISSMKIIESRLKYKTMCMEGFFHMCLMIIMALW
jgi:hypothetical protein